MSSRRFVGYTPDPAVFGQRLNFSGADSALTPGPFIELGEVGLAYDFPDEVARFQRGENSLLAVV